MKNDRQIIKNIIEKYNSIKGPRVGDFLTINNTLFRLAYKDNSLWYITFPDEFATFHFQDEQMKCIGDVHKAIEESLIDPTPLVNRIKWKTWAYDGKNRPMPFMCPFRAFVLKKELINNIP